MSEIIVSRREWVFISALCLACSPGFAAEYDVRVASATVAGETIPVYLYKPKGVGPFPLIVLSHGNPRSPDERVKVGRQTLNDQAVVFAQSGAAVAVPIRKGVRSQFVLRRGLPDGLLAA